MAQTNRLMRTGLWHRILRTIQNVPTNHPYALALQSATLHRGHQDELQKALISMAISRIVYLPDLLRTDELEYQLPFSDSGLRLHVHKFVEAHGKGYLYENANKCHVCTQEFTNVQQTSKNQSKQRVLGALLRPRHHCCCCFRSVCTSDSTVVNGHRICSLCIAAKDYDTSPILENEVQYVVSTVPDHNCIVVAFRGTQTLTDLVIDGQTAPLDLVSDLELSSDVQHCTKRTMTGDNSDIGIASASHSDSHSDSDSDNTSQALVQGGEDGFHILAHGGVVSHLKHIYGDITSQVQSLLDNPQHKGKDIILCGHSLGGAYATACALRMLADSTIRSTVLTHNLRVHTFGAPRIVFSSSENNTVLHQLAPSPSSFCSSSKHHQHTACGWEREQAEEEEKETMKKREENRKQTEAATCTSPARDLANVNTSKNVAAEESTALLFLRTTFQNYVNQTDLIPRLLGNRIAGRTLAPFALPVVGRRFMSVQLHKSQISKDIDKYTHLGCVRAFTADETLVDIQPEDEKNFFKLYPYDAFNMLKHHDTDGYLERVAAAYALATSIPDTDTGVSSLEPCSFDEGSVCNLVEPSIPVVPTTFSSIVSGHSPNGPGCSVNYTKADGVEDMEAGELEEEESWLDFGDDRNQHIVGAHLERKVATAA
eukprot:m.59418 g.59418  ORF g.59418 m.59418 type:complete len:655 (-) comp11771_c0_seq1:341-2305(-)